MREKTRYPTRRDPCIRKTALCFPRFSCLIGGKARKAPCCKAAIKITKQVINHKARKAGRASDFGLNTNILPRKHSSLYFTHIFRIYMLRTTEEACRLLPTHESSPCHRTTGLWHQFLDNRGVFTSRPKRTTHALNATMCTIRCSVPQGRTARFASVACYEVRSLETLLPLESVGCLCKKRLPTTWLRYSCELWESK